MARQNLGDMVVRIVADNAEFDAAIDKSHNKFKKFAEDAGRLGKTLTKFVTLPILGAAGAAVKFAIDAEETRAKFLTAFRGIEKQAQNTAKNLAKNYGLARTQSERLLSTTGDLLKGFGANATEALGLSETVQKLAVDLASYNNLQGGAERASNILTRAMLGEREALTSLGTKVSEAAVETKLLERGQKDLEGQALLLAKAQATLDIVMEQSKDAMGDFERTSGSAANRLRTLRARINDIATSFGQTLLPVVENLLGKVESIANHFAALEEEQLKTIITVGLLAAAIGPLLLALRAVSTTLTAIQAHPIVAAVTAVTALIAGVAILARRLNAQAREQQKVNEAMERYEQLLINVNTLQGQARIAELEKIIALLKEEREAIITTAVQEENRAFKQVSLLENARKIADAELEITQQRGEQNQVALQNLINQNFYLTQALEKLPLISEAEELFITELKAELEALIELRAEWRALADDRDDSGDAPPEDSRVDKIKKTLAAELELADRREAIAQQTGEDFDMIREKREAYLSAIDDLTNAETGYFTILSSVIQDYIADLEELGATEEELEAAREEARRLEEEEADKERDRQKLRDQFARKQLGNLEQQEKAVDDLRKVYIEAGVDELEAQRWATNEIEKLRDAAEQKELDRIEKRKRERINEVNAFVNGTIAAFTAINQAYQQHVNNQIAELDRQLQADIEAQGLQEETTIERLQKQLDDAIEANDAEKAHELENEIRRLTALEKLNTEYENEKAQLVYKAAKVQWELNMLTAAANGALAVLKGLADVGLVGGILAGIAAAASLVAVALAEPKAPPALAEGGIALPRPGGQSVRVAEAGQPEIIAPLDRLGEILASFPTQSMAGTGEGGEGGDIHLTVQMDSKPILQQIFPATRNREILIDARAVV